MSELDRAASAVGADLEAIFDALLVDVFKDAHALAGDGLNWMPAGTDNNAFTLAYHLLGSADYWIGEVVGGRPTGRVRAEEFNREGTLEELEARLRDVSASLRETLVTLPGTALLPAPIDLGRGLLSWGVVPPEGRSAVWVVVHDLCHIAYHLGQLDVIRGMWEERTVST